MDLNADFSERVVIHSSEVPWKASPMKGVERRMLDRMGDEVARATTIVRYAPNSRFSAHTHAGGEEFVVLDGVFQDEHGDFPAGSYVRNPPTSSHTPGSAQGCTIFVKLWQFDPDDRQHVNIDTNSAKTEPDPARKGVSVLPLFKDAHEDVRVEVWEAGSASSIDMPGGCELLVLEGSVQEGGEVLSRHDWLRIPAGGRLDAKAGEDGAKLWVKRGHLASLPQPPFGAD